jgi:hypothetical protein
MSAKGERRGGTTGGVTEGGNITEGAPLLPQAVKAKAVLTLPADKNKLCKKARRDKPLLSISRKRGCILNTQKNKKPERDHVVADAFVMKMTK